MLTFIFSVIAFICLFIDGLYYFGASVLVFCSIVFAVKFIGYCSEKQIGKKHTKPNDFKFH